MNSPLNVITGGAGFIGANLAKCLLSAGESVRILDDLSRPGVERNVDWLRERHSTRLELRIGDVRDPSSVSDAVRGATTVFHFAAQVAVTTSLADPVRDFEVNARGTINVLEALRAMPQPAHLFFTSTNKVYGALEDVALERGATRYSPAAPDVRQNGIAEHRLLDFYSPYGCSKGAADQYVLDYARNFGLPTTVFRMSCIYGPRQFGTEDQGWLAHFFIQAMQDKPITIYGDGRQVRDVLAVDDLVDAFLAARQATARVIGQAFNIGGGPANTISLLELLSLMDELHGYRATTFFDQARPGDQRYYVSDVRKFGRATAWSPRIGIRDGVARLHKWLTSRTARGSAATSEYAEGRA